MTRPAFAAAGTPFRPSAPRVPSHGLPSLSQIVGCDQAGLCGRRHTVPSRVVPSRVVPSPSCPVPSCPVPSCPVPSCPVPSCPVPSCPVPSCPVPSCPVPICPVPRRRFHEQEATEATEEDIPLRSPLTPLPPVQKSLSPTCPVPTCPVPICPVPICPVPICPVPICPVPICPVPICPVPICPVPICPVPICPVPRTQFHEQEATEATEEDIPLRSPLTPLPPVQKSPSRLVRSEPAGDECHPPTSKKENPHRAGDKIPARALCSFLGALQQAGQVPHFTPHSRRHVIPLSTILNFDPDRVYTGVETTWKIKSAAKMTPWTCRFGLSQDQPL